MLIAEFLSQAHAALVVAAYPDQRDFILQCAEGQPTILT